MASNEPTSINKNSDSIYTCNPQQAKLLTEKSTLI